MPLLRKLDKLGSFSDIVPSLVGYRSGNHEDYYLTFDFVDAGTANRFLPRPVDTIEDPDHLIADWQRYEALVSRFQVDGTMSSRFIACPAFHCLGDRADPRVAELTHHIEASAPAHIEELRALLRQDHDERKRAAAAFLVAYGTDARVVRDAIAGSLRDSSELVRNNAMRVLLMMIREHPEVQIDLDVILDGLSFPATLDRNKSAAVLEALARRGLSRSDTCHVVEKSGTVLLAMLRLRQPNNHDFAYEILKKLSGEAYQDRQYDRWEHWIAAVCARA